MPTDMTSGWSLPMPGSFTSTLASQSCAQLQLETTILHGKAVLFRYILYVINRPSCIALSQDVHRCTELPSSVLSISWLRNLDYQVGRAMFSCARGPEGVSNLDSGE